MEIAKTSEEGIINHLLQLSQQSERGFANTAEHIRNRGLKMVLKTYAQQCVRFGDELQTLLGANKSTATTDEHASGGLKRG
jgi:hypothetical protein